VPGTVNDENWSYRIPALVSGLLADRGAAERLSDLFRRSGRIREGAA
jgi:4-alpha-glucanotransferase